MTQRIYVGSFTPDTNGRGEGITLFEQDAETGGLTSQGTVAALPSPAYLAWHPSRQYLYSVSELAGGSVHAFAVDASGALTALGHQPTGGTFPCHLSVHASGQYAVSANYGSGSVAVHPIGADGTLGERSDFVQHSGTGPQTDRQEGPHAHNARFDLAGRYAIVTDLGTDEVWTYALDLGTGRLAPAVNPPARTAPGAGPRHVAIHPNGHVYVACELDSTITTFGYDAESGQLDPVATVSATVDTPPERNYPSEIGLSADGGYLYIANRGANCITAFAVDGPNLTPLADVHTGGRWPRHFAIAGDFLYVADQESDGIVVLRIDRTTGVPAVTATITHPTPACILPA